MPNRAERRAQEKRNRRGIPQQYDQTRGRGRSGMIDEYALQQKSIRLQEGTDGEWKPTASFETPEMTADTDIALRNPKLVKAPHSVRQWFRVFSWALIVIAAIAFVVVMWLPTKPIWLSACSACSSPRETRSTTRIWTPTAPPCDRAETVPPSFRSPPTNVSHALVGGNRRYTSPTQRRIQHDTG